MAIKKLSFLIPLLTFVSILLMLEVSTVSLFHLQQVWSRTKGSYLIFQGDATSNVNVLQLTKLDSKGNPVSGSVGRGLYSSPVRLFLTGASFFVNFSRGGF